MLILTRKKGERVKLIKDGKLLCEVVLQSGTASLGFIADKSIKILRSELHEFDGNPNK